MKSLLKTFAATLLLVASCGRPSVATIDLDTLSDKIKGGWAGQTFGCAYGGPTEFRYCDRMVPDDVNVGWDDCNKCQWYHDTDPGLYDDVYMDLSFLAVIDRLGMDAPVDSFAVAFANAAYPLWHANQAARYNIQNGMKAPDTGFWKNNPHADDIDFQIEADFAGLVCPGMPGKALQLCDKVGHIMNYGDGYYGGLYVATMYSLAFVYDDIDFIVNEALKAIPAKSRYHQCMSDVIKWCREESDWKAAWQKIEDKWSQDLGCPDGVDNPFNIDAIVNSAYIVVGLLYGEKDMEKTLDIAMRCGKDSDCNPASAAGILGTVLGYSNIPEKWTSRIEETLDNEFAYTSISLRKANQMTLRLALDNIEANGGKVGNSAVEMSVGKVKTARYEKSFEGLEFAFRDNSMCDNLRQTFTYEFDGAAIVLSGLLWGDPNIAPADYVAELEISVDGAVEQLLMPLDSQRRKLEVYWNYSLEQGHHTIQLRWLNPVDGTNVLQTQKIVYNKI